MKKLFSIGLTSCAIALLSTIPAKAEHPNVSDITGPNVSDITGPNVSDITGPNASDITGTNVSANTTARTRRAIAAGFNNQELEELAREIGVAFAVCDAGGDCGTLVRLLETSERILDGH